MSNVTVKPGQRASFKCQVDMSCIVAYIEWYHEMDNGTLKLIKVRRIHHGCDSLGTLAIALVETAPCSLSIDAQVVLHCRLLIHHMNEVISSLADRVSIMKVTLLGCPPLLPKFCDEGKPVINGPELLVKSCVCVVFEITSTLPLFMRLSSNITFFKSE